MTTSEKLEKLGQYGRYEVQAEIGGGAMGRVFRGYDPLARRLVAIKTIKPDLLSKTAADEYVRRFRREAQAAGGLSHPNIVIIYDVGENFLVMELLDGETLQAVLDRRGRVSLHEAIDILAPVADALDHAHRKGIVHRDIKPANIMILPGRGPKLMDFGVVHVESTVMTTAGQRLGSPLYMAPEQVASGAVSARSDVFSLAAVAYEMVTGRRAFEGQSITSIINRVMHATPAPPRSWNVALPPHYDDVFARALAKDPDARYASTKDFIAALDVKDFDDHMRSAFAPAALLADAPAPSVVAPLPPGAFETIPLGTRTLPPEPLVEAPRTAPPLPAVAPASPHRQATPARVVIGLALCALVAVAWLARPRTPPVAEAVPPGMPPLRVESEPPGAQAFLDDREVGRTPLSLGGVATGSHVVRVTHDGFAPAQVSVTVTGSRLPPLRFVLEPAVAPLSVASEPPQGAVFLDDKPIGKTPLAGLVISPGSHDLRIERNGHRAWQTTFVAEIGKPVEITAQLARAVAVRRPDPTPVPTPVVREGDLVELTADVVPPRRIAGRLAAYPSGAAKKKLQGRVTIALLVDEKGEPRDLQVVQSAGEPLDRAVLESAREWRYEPAQKNGVKVRVRIEESQSFELSRR